MNGLAVVLLTILIPIFVAEHVGLTETYVVENLEDTSVLQVIYLISLTFAWIRGLAYFRSFSDTRYLTSMIVECLKDMKTFLILLMYSGMAFTFILLNAGNDKNIADCLQISFLIALGDWDSSGWELAE